MKWKFITIANICQICHMLICEVKPFTDENTEAGRVKGLTHLMRPWGLKSRQSTWYTERKKNIRETQKKKDKQTRKQKTKRQGKTLVRPYYSIHLASVISLFQACSQMQPTCGGMSFSLLRQERETGALRYLCMTQC